MSRSYPTTYPILLLRKTARRGNRIPRRALQSRDGGIRTRDPLNPISGLGVADPGNMPYFLGLLPGSIGVRCRKTASYRVETVTRTVTRRCPGIARCHSPVADLNGVPAMDLTIWAEMA